MALGGRTPWHDCADESEVTLLRAQRLGRLAVVGADGLPYVETVAYQLRGTEVLVGGPGYDEAVTYAVLSARGVGALLVEDRHGVVPDRGVVLRGPARAAPGLAVPAVLLTVREVQSWGLTQV